MLLEPERSEQQQPGGDEQAEADAEDPEESERTAPRSGSDQHNIGCGGSAAKDQHRRKHRGRGDRRDVDHEEWHDARLGPVPSCSTISAT